MDELEEETFLGRCVHRMVSRTCWLFWGYIAGFMLLTMIVGAPTFVEQGEYDWIIASSDASQTLDALSDAMSRVDRGAAVGGDDGAQQARTSPSWYANVYYHYSWADGRQASIWTPDNLQSMCELERLFTRNVDYPSYCLLTPEAAALNATDTFDSCQMPAQSVPALFYSDAWAAAGNAWNCTLLGASDVDAKARSMYDALAEGTELAKLQYGFFVEKQWETHGYTSTTRTAVQLGAPLSGFDGQNDELVEQMKIYHELLDDVEDDMFKKLSMKTNLFESYYRPKPPTLGQVQVEFHSLLFRENEFERLVWGDFLMCVLSIMFVTFWIFMHTGSGFLTQMGMWQILMSFPLSYAFMNLLFLGTPYFAQIHILAIFLILGIGADDIFVFIDAWKQTAELTPPQVHAHAQNEIRFSKCVAENRSQQSATRINQSICSISLTKFCFVKFCRQGPDVARVGGMARAREIQRLRVTYKRSAQAVFNTSFTTMVAFIATAVSPIVPISSFGLFAALAILWNYIFVLTILPVTTLLWHRFFHARRCCESVRLLLQRSSWATGTPAEGPHSSPTLPASPFSGRASPSAATRPEKGSEKAAVEMVTNGKAKHADAENGKAHNGDAHNGGAENGKTQNGDAEEGGVVTAVAAG